MSRRIGRSTLVAGVAAAGLAAITMTPGTALAADYPPAGVSCSITPDPATQNGPVALTCTGYQVSSVVDIFSVSNSKVTNPHATPHAIPAGSAGGSIAHPRTAPAPAGTPAAPGVFTVSEQALAPGSARFKVVGYNTLGAMVTIGLDTRVLTTASDSVARTCTDTSSTVSPSTIESGETTTVSGKGFNPGSTVTITDGAGDSLGTTTATSTGAYSTDITVTRTGSLTIYAAGASTGSCDKRSSASHLTVASTAGGGSSLPFTGADGIGTMLLVGAGLVAAGTGTIAASRRRKLLASSTSAA